LGAAMGSAGFKAFAWPSNAHDGSMAFADSDDGAHSAPPGRRESHG
jgi:hypothetical protein